MIDMSIKLCNEILGEKMNPNRRSLKEINKDMQKIIKKKPTKKQLKELAKALKPKKYKSLAKIVAENISNLEHFIEHGGWNIYTPKKEAEKFIQECGDVFIYEDGKLKRDKNKELDTALLLEYYKFKYNEISELYSSKLNKIEQILNE